MSRSWGTGAVRARFGVTRRWVRTDGATLAALVMREHLAIEQRTATTLFAAVTPAIPRPAGRLVPAQRGVA